MDEILLTIVLMMVWATVGFFCYVLGFGGIHNVLGWGMLIAAVCGVIIGLFTRKLWRLI